VKFMNGDTRAWRARSQQMFNDGGTMASAMNDSFPYVTGAAFFEQMEYWYQGGRDRFRDPAVMPGFHYTLEVWNRGDIILNPDKVVPWYYEFEGARRAITYEWNRKYSADVTGAGEADPNWLDMVLARLPEWDVAFNQRFNDAWAAFHVAMNRFYPEHKSHDVYKRRIHMESKIDTKVTLYDADGKRIGETFSRRARQLVKQQRALWADETHTAIRFLPDAAEPWEMEAEPDPGHYTPSSDDALYALAKKRIRSRRILFWHALALLPGFVFFVILGEAVFWRPGNNYVTGFFIGATFALWSAWFVYNICQFIKYNRGFYPFAGSEARHARKLAYEVEQLKRMGYGA
jgi:hypothetical protein